MPLGTVFAIRPVPEDPCDETPTSIEPFFTTKKGRLGIGLSIANGIWRRHRGTLALLTRPGEGVTVRMCVDPSL